MNNFEKHDTAESLADCHSGYALAKQVLDLREENDGLYQLLADIRAAAGDAKGQLMQDKFVAHIGQHRLESDRERALRQKADECVAELEAHVEAAKDNVSAHISLGMANISKPVFIRRMVDWHDSTPAASLARRDLIKQAEVLRETADEFEIHERARQVLSWKADKLTQQAEALT